MSNHLKSSNDMLDGLDDCIVTAGGNEKGCAINTLENSPSSAITSCAASGCPSKGKLYKNSNGFYAPNLSAADFSGYTRYSEIRRIGVDGGVVTEARIKTVVK